MIDEADQGEFRRAIENLVRDRKPLIVRGDSSERLQCRLSDRCLGTIVVQLRALGLIAKSARKRSLKDTETYWTLTPYGDNVMTKLRAIRRGAITEAGAYTPLEPTAEKRGGSTAIR